MTGENDHFADFVAALEDAFADIGGHLTCTETEDAVAALRAAGHDRAADELFEGHVENDEYGDLHFPTPAETGNGPRSTLR